ncbi:high frequency lysogenization protein HflD [Luteimonas sp. e5]
MNAQSMPQRVMPLAGLVLALQEVRHLAENGRVDQRRLQTAIDSVFRTDAASVADVYGGVEPLADGLRALNGYLGGAAPDAQVPKLTLALMQLERHFDRAPDAVDGVRDAIERLATHARTDGSTHPDILRELGAIYARHLSPLKPKVMIQGNPHYLGREDVVAEIRALLLAGLRSVVLWRQMGGSQWDLLLKRRDMRRAIAELLATVE